MAQELTYTHPGDDPMTKTIKDWSVVRDIPASTIRSRLSRGFTVGQALGYEPQSKRKRRKKAKANGIPTGQQNEMVLQGIRVALDTDTEDSAKLAFISRLMDQAVLP